MESYGLRITNDMFTGHKRYVYGMKTAYLGHGNATFP